MRANPSVTNEFAGPMRIALIVGVVAAAAAVAGLFISGPGQFFQAYLFAFLFWLGVTLGSLALLAVHFAVVSRWGLSIRRIAAAAAGSTWVMALLFVPLLFGLPYLFPWARPQEVAASTVLQYKTWYLNVPFFIIRAVIYFAVWIGLAFFINRKSAQLASTPEDTPLELKRSLAGLGSVSLIIYGLTITFASVDWIMSLQPLWTSTAFGVITAVGQVLSGMAFCILVLNLFPSLALGRKWTYDSTPIPYQDLGALLLVLVMSWAYVAFFQLLIIWAGNIPSEVIWYKNRVAGGWAIVADLIALLQFVLPFIILLTIRVRHNLRALAGLSVMLLFSNMLNMFWHVKPAFYPTGFAISWLDIAALVAVSGIWLAGFFFTLSRRPALTEQEAVALKLVEAEKAGA